MSREGGYPCVNAPGCPCHTQAPGYTCMACYLDPSRTRAFQEEIRRPVALRDEALRLVARLLDYPRGSRSEMVFRMAVRRLIRRAAKLTG